MISILKLNKNNNERKLNEPIMKLNVVLSMAVNFPLKKSSCFFDR